MSQQAKRNRTSHANTFARESGSILATSVADNRIYRRRVALVGTITSDAVSRINSVISMDPSSAPDWASISALYDEFRVVGCRLKLVSRTQNTVTLASNAIFVIYDNDDNGVVASYASAAEYQTAHMIPALFNNAFTYVFNFARPASGAHTALDWVDIATPTLSTGAVKFYGDTLSATTNYFTYMIEWAVEFRGVR